MWDGIHLRHNEDGSFAVSFDLNIEVSTIRLGLEHVLRHRIP